jgi:predicted hydrocarbon binding protein
MNTPAPNYNYPNRMGRIILMSLEEIIGRTGVSAVLNRVDLKDYIGNYPPHNQDLNFPFKHVSLILGGLEALYGPHGGRGIALRGGRSCFQYGLREFGPLFGLTDLTFRLLPLQTKLKVGSNSFAEIFNRYSDQCVVVEHESKQVVWKITRCPMCWERHTDAPACDLAVGVLQEALYWVSGGKYFHLEETQCVGRGDESCTIVIDKTPLS